ncbi:MAG: DNA polymerase III subunit gamma/tau, partial [Bacteroidia bacterium]
MDNFIVSARKYRPTTFDTVIGQESITSTLKNAIKTNHLSQSYLFCGPRGVGKTTCARILAKTINCLNLGENIEACDKCESCRSFNTSRSFNIHELDAASNNKVDDIRTLTELVRIPPQVGRYSIYIIDEVHMLSTSAFNAFLKTLEEPPAHAIFILATTEKQKIIPTILSRCQIFDFHRITIDDIVSRLEFVAKGENIETELEALHIIAQKADGAMRDALSIFDQIVSFSGKMVTYSGVIENLNVLDYEYYLKITDAFMSNDLSTSLLIFNEILEKGFDGHNFIAGLSSHFRNLMVCKNEQTARLMEVGASIRDRYMEQTSRVSPGLIYRALDILGNCDINYRASRNPRLHVEIALVRLVTLYESSPGGGATDTTEKPVPAKVQTVPAPARNNPTTENNDEPETAPRKAVEQAGEYRPTSKSFSIKKQLMDASEDPDQVEDNHPNAISDKMPAEISKDFDHEMLIRSWNAFGEKVGSESPRMSGIIKGMQPKLLEANSVELTLSTEAQK